MTETTSLTEALLAFHRDAGELDLKKTASGVHSAYLPLDAAMEQIRPLLAKHGLYAQHWTAFYTEGGPWVAGTKIVHAASGDEIDSGPFPLAPAKSDAQGWGGALTYARRYTLMEVLALVADTDDDGGGSGSSARRPKATRTPGKITAAQRNELMSAVREAKVPTERATEIIKLRAGVEKSTDIPSEKFLEVLEAIQAEKA